MAVCPATWLLTARERVCLMDTPLAMGFTNMPFCSSIH